MLRAADSKKIVIEDLIDAFVGADIPLQKVDKLLPFFKKNLKEGGTIPQAPTLRQIYLPNGFVWSFLFIIQSWILIGKICLNIF
jgi:hypothetical protein